MQKVTTKEILESLVEGKAKIKDCSNNGKCSQCGECCSNFLPVSQKEIENIQDYVLKNNIKPQKHMLIMQNRLSCPYHDGKKCLVYEVRPLICKEFYCYKEPTIEMAEKFASEERICVNMWGIAEEIEKIGGKYDNSKSRQECNSKL